MKIFLPILSAASLFLLISCRPAPEKADQPEEQPAVSLSASELLDKAIQYHDPQGKWETFSGQVRLITTYPREGRNYGEEIIEIRNDDNYYRCTINRDGGVAVRGIEAGQCFREVNGNNEPSEEELAAFILDCEGTKQFQQHQSRYFQYR